MADLPLLRVDHSDEDGKDFIVVSTSSGLEAFQEAVETAIDGGKGRAMLMTRSGTVVTFDFVRDNREARFWPAERPGVCGQEEI